MTHWIKAHAFEFTIGFALGLTAGLVILALAVGFMK